MKKVKIIKVDNFDREGPGHDHELIATNVQAYWGTKLVDYLNQESDERSDEFFRLVADDFKLQVFEP